MSHLSTKFEYLYYAILATVTVELIWVRKFLEDVPINNQIPIKLYENNPLIVYTVGEIGTQVFKIP